jgi:hypothetical protein
MRSLAYVLVMLLLVSGSAPSWGGGKSAAITSPALEVQLAEWCASYFPTIRSAPLWRPVKKLAPLNLNEMSAPSDLIATTQTAGKLPWYVERYRGTWIAPTVEPQIPGAIFVERLTPTEMTIALVLPKQATDKKASQEGLRLNLIWTGKEFADALPWPKGSRGFVVQVSPFGDAMYFMVIGHPPNVPKNGDGSPAEEVHGMCFISSKHH